MKKLLLFVLAAICALPCFAADQGKDAVLSTTAIQAREDYDQSPLYFLDKYADKGGVVVKKVYALILKQNNLGDFLVTTLAVENAKINSTPIISQNFVGFKLNDTDRLKENSKIREGETYDFNCKSADTYTFGRNQSVPLFTDCYALPN